MKNQRWVEQSVGSTLYIINSDSQIVCDLTLVLRERGEIAYEIAALIVRAVNNFEELSSAANNFDELLKQLKSVHKHSHMGYKCAEKKCGIALAIAKAENE